MKAPRRACLAALAASLLGGCAAARAQVPDLAGPDWVLAAMPGQPPPDAAGAPRLRFDTATGRVSGSTGVNNINGSFERQASSLKFGPLISTRRAGPPQAMALESQFVRLLEATAAMRLSAQTLELLDASGAMLARLDAAPSR